MAAMGPRRFIPSWKRLRGDSAGYPPTLRQLEVVAAVARNGGIKEAGAELGLSPSTVKNHLSEVSHRLETEGAFSQTLLALSWLTIPDDKAIAVQVLGGHVPELRRALEGLRASVDDELARLAEVTE
jgi:DNA-binding CsgD family transcriptional regulator